MKSTQIKDLYREKAVFNARTGVAVALCAALVGLLIWRLYQLQVVQQPYFASRADANKERLTPVAPVRGLIYDRNGVVLAQNAPSFVLELIPEQVKDKAEVLDRLQTVIALSDNDRARFFERLRSTPRYRGVSVRGNLSKEEVARFEMERHRFPGLAVNATLTRSYPLGASTSHVVGYVGGINKHDLEQEVEGTFDGLSQVGKTGIERQHERLLRGRAGVRVMEANAMGRPLRELDFKPGEGGQSAVLALDSRLQLLAEQALAGRSGAVVAIDPRDGSVLALVSNPGFDPSLFVEGIDQKSYQTLLDDPARPLYNRALAGTYPPGSTIKPFVALAGLNYNVVDARHTEYCSGSITLPGSSRKYRCWRRTGHGALDMKGGVMHSCDVYFYQLAMALGIDRIHDFLSPFGLGQATGIDLPQEREGILPSSEWKRRVRKQPWYPGETLSAGIGQGYVTSTPLQLAQAVARLAMRGGGYAPRLLVATQDPISGERQPLPPTALEPIPNRHPNEWEQVINAMEATNREQGGTGFKVFGDAPYRSAGKSGTAQVAALSQEDIKAKALEDTPYHLRDHALFIAFAPVDQPQIAVAVIVEHAGGGSSNAGPVARQVIDQALLGTVLYKPPPPPPR